MIDAIRCETHEEGPTREPVLVVLHSDGWVEVYGERKRVSVQVVQRVHSTADGVADLLDEAVERDAKRHAELYYPRNLLTTGQCERVTAADRVERAHTLGMIDALAAGKEEP